MNPPWLDTTSLSHQRTSVRGIMFKVVLALLPGTVAYACFIHTQILINVLIACSSALIIESLILRLRQRAILTTINDGSIVVAAWLLTLCLPPTLPHWQLVTGVFVMCTLGKHVFGGLGHNPFNPAMVAYTILIISFPVDMTHWQTDQGIFDKLNATQSDNQSGSTEQETQWDGLTQATPLDRLRQTRRENAASAGLDGSSVSSQASIAASDQVFETNWFPVTMGWLIGGLYLLLTRVITWHIPVSVLFSLTIVYSVYGFWAAPGALGPVSALFSGAIVFGAFFIATDPVSSATSNVGKLIYGAGIGILCFVIREFSAYPEGFAFAVLLMNICVPLIDYSTTRSTAGVLSHRSRGDNK